MMGEFDKIVDECRRTFASGKTLPLDFRKGQLQQIKKLIVENERELCQAVYKDLRKSAPQGYVTELTQSLGEIEDTLKHLDKWASPQAVRRSLMVVRDEATLVPEPLGVVLIIGPWNYPVELILHPLVSALAAGNCVVLKPSEVAEHSGALLTKLIWKYLDREAVKVVCGGVAETTDLLAKRFDHIFYTGSSPVGKIVMAAAAKHLTPVTLELGGKCPVVVDASADLEVAAKRIAWAKWMNCGQTCVAPDYILTTEEVKPKLISGLNKAIQSFYPGGDIQKHVDYSRLINERHFDFSSRLTALLERTKGSAVIGGSHFDRKDLYIEPTVVDHVKVDDALMEDEIFGPILPVLTVKSVDEAVATINAKEKPLACYVFANRDGVVRRVVDGTSSGGVCVNDCILHMTLDTLPFGGVGNSGMGAYHGKFGFDTFSHAKPVLKRQFAGEKMLWIRYPPFDENKAKWARRMLAVAGTKLPDLACVWYLVLLLAGLGVGIFLQKLLRIF